MMRAGIGLNRDTDLVYRTMLRRPRWRTDQLGYALGWPKEDIHQHVNQLLSDGLVVASADIPEAYRAIEPALALPALAARCFRDLDEDAMRSRFGGINEVIALRDRYVERQGDTGDLRGLDEMASTVERIVTGVTEQVTMLLPRYVRGAVEFSTHIAEAILRRNARMRSIWSMDFVNVEPAAEHARWLVKRSACPRFVPRVPVRAVLVDRRAAVLVDENDKVRVEQDERALAELAAAADYLWEQGTEARGQAAASREQCCSERLEVVLRLLSEGLTDDAVARRLGVSVRTVRNDVASTMKVLEARSRFQAGATAARLGLI